MEKTFLTVSKIIRIVEKFKLSRLKSNERPLLLSTWTHRLKIFQFSQEVFLDHVEGRSVQIV